MDVLRSLAAAAVATVALASCGAQAADRADDASSTTGALAAPAESAEDLFASIDDAVAQETSVRQEVGNLNPPPTLVVEQEYGDGRDQMAFTMDVGPDTAPLRAYQVDGFLYFEGEDPQPTNEIDPDETALVAALVRSDVRQDFQRMAERASDFSYVGEEDVAGTTTRHYRTTLNLVPGANPAMLGSQAEGPMPADLWIAASGLPVRVEVKYSEPLGGIAGTGTVRTDYAAWSDPLDLDPENLDWD